MASTQTRRSVSVKGVTLQRLKKHVAETGQSVSGFIEDLVAEKLGPPTEEDRRKFGEAMEAREERSKAAKAKDTDDLEPYITPIKLL